MGCGAVCSTESPLSLKHQHRSKQNLLALLPHVSINAPLLPQTYFQQFSTSLRQNVSPYLMRVSSRIFSTEDCPPLIVQKWRVLLFGLDKDDYTYRRCLGFAPGKQVKSTAALQGENKCEESGANPQYHSCFEQIEKDLNRTFDFKQHTKQLFEETLKKIANHFPTMGYTQGVNFVVGYLLILGYQANDAFWFFVHLAMNRRYLLLGLYQDGFPLANVYTLVFKNILKRIDVDLYNHIYVSLMLDDSVWIFKWFITCYLYSFPIQTIKYVWDVFIEMGSLGLVYFAVALVVHMRSKLIQIDDPCDMSQFLQSLKELSVFNEIVKMDDVVETCYEIAIQKNDFQGIDQLKPSFYQKYYQLYQSQLHDPKLPQLKIPKKSQKKIDIRMNTHLEQWWVKLLQERLQFLGKPSPQKSSHLVEGIPEELKEDYEDMQKSLKLLEDIVLQNESNKFSQHNIENAEGNDNYFNDLVIPDIQELSPQFTSSPSSQAEFQNRLQTKISYDVGQIDELQQYSDSNGEYQRSENYTNSIANPPSQEPSIYIEPQHSNRQHANINITSLTGSLDQDRRRKEPIVKANHLRIETGGIRSGFGLAGQNILGNLSSCQSQHSSVDSKYTSYKPKKQKENNLPRTKANKVRIDDYSQRSGISNQLSSQHESSIDRRTDKDSYSNLTSRQNTKKTKMKDLYVQRRTEQELMAASHGPQKKMSNQKCSGSEIEIFNGQGLFKKKKRSYNRNSIVTSINQDLNNKETNFDVRPRRTIQDQQSLESVLELSACRKERPREISSMLYEIESVK